MNRFFQKNTAVSRLLDRLGICASAACMVHCVALTLMVLVAPVLSAGIFDSEWFHALLLLFIVPVGAMAFWAGYLSHGRRRLLLAGISGLFILVLAAVLEMSLLPPLAAAALTSVGGIMLISAHWGNLRCRRCATDHGDCAGADLPR